MELLEGAKTRMRIAAVDIGSNSIHMVVAQVESDGRFRVLDRAKERVRLGSRSLAEGRLTDDAMNTGVSTLRAFSTLAERQGVTRIQAVATAAVREAANGGDFVQRVRDEVGLRVRVIPGREEARLIFLGVSHAIDMRHEPTLIVDAGGGSVEIIRVENGEPKFIASVKLGVTRLAERFLPDDPPSSKDIKALNEHIDGELAAVIADCRGRGLKRMVVTSGTLLHLTSIAAVASGMDPEGHLNHLTVAASELTKLRKVLQKADRAARLRVPGLDPKRADLVVPGVCVADTLIQALNLETVISCTWALREGVLLDFIARHPRRLVEAEVYADPRQRSVARLRRHCGDDGTHGAHVRHLADQLYVALRDDLALPDPARDWLGFAAELHDIGHHIRHQDHQRHSWYLITNAELLGFQRFEIDIIAAVARYHRKGPPKDGDEALATLSKAHRRVVRALSALLRIADGLDRGHYGVVHDVSLSRRSGRMTIRAHGDGEDTAIELWEARRRGGLLSEVLGREIEFQSVESLGNVKRTASVSR